MQLREMPRFFPFGCPTDSPSTFIGNLTLSVRVGFHPFCSEEFSVSPDAVEISASEFMPGFAARPVGIALVFGRLNPSSGLQQHTLVFREWIQRRGLTGLPHTMMRMG
jgi:hypothetical protein